MHTHFSPKALVVVNHQVLVIVDIRIYFYARTADCDTLNVTLIVDR